MGSRVKGITIEIGGDTTGLDKALQGTDKNINNVRKDLKDVERLLKLDPTNTELLRQKFTLLSKELDENEKKLNSLKEAEKQVQQQFERGDIGEDQYNALKREVIATENSINYLQNAVKDAERAINKVDEKPIDDVAKAADEAEKELKQAGKEASNFSDYLKAEAIVEGAKGLVSTMKDISEESKELNMDLSRLEQNAKESGVGMDAAKNAFEEFAIQSGETDSAIEGVSNLLQAGFTESNLQKAVEGLSGAAQRFPDTLKIESLADSLQETLVTGTATGQFAEMLDRVGVGAENFSEKLATCTTDAEKQNLVLTTLAEQGLNDSYNAWKKNNEELYESNKAQVELNDELAELGETIMPLFTTVTELVTNLLEKFNGLDEGTQKFILSAIALVAILGPMLSMFGTIGLGVGGMSSLIENLSTTVLPALQGAFTNVFGFIAANPIVLLIAAIVAFVALIATKGDEIQGILERVDEFLQNVFATDWTKIFGPVLGEVLNSFFANIKNIWDSIKQIFNGIINFIRGVFTGDWQRAWNDVKEIFSGIFNGLVSIAKIPINGIIGLLNIAINAVNSMIAGFNSIGFTMPKWLGGGSWHPSIPFVPNVAYLANGGALLDGTAVVGEAGPEILTVSGGKAIVQPLTGNATAGKGLSELMGLLNMYLPYLASSTPVVLDNGVLVGELTPEINDELGRIAERERYR